MLNNNDIFRRLQLLMGLSNDKALLRLIFEKGGSEASNSQIKGWRTSLDNPRASMMYDHKLETFINGLFWYRDTKRAAGIEVFVFPQNKTK